MKDELDFLPAALEIQERPPSPAGRSILWSIVVFFSFALLWAIYGSVDIVATAQGKIIPSGRVKVIQPMEIGVVREIHVEEGQPVQAGDLLIALDPTATQADLGRLELELLAARLDEVRLRRLYALASSNKPGSNGPLSPQLDLPQALQTAATPQEGTLQEQMLISQWSEHVARTAALDNTVDSRKADLAATREEQAKLEATLPLITRRANALKGLVAKKLSAEQTWLELEEKRLQQKQDLSALKSRVKQVQASIREAEQQRVALVSEFKRETLSDITETERHISDLEQERLKATQRTNLQRLTAPVSGVVQQLAVHTIGGVVTPAQELMKIVPESQNLEVEAWIQNKDIGFVNEGQSAEVKVETFPFTKYGTIDADVVDVSRDAVSDEHLGLVYAGRVRMNESVMQVGEKLVNLSPGMAVTVEVKTGKRRLIEYILSPLFRYKYESMTER